MKKNGDKWEQKLTLLISIQNETFFYLLHEVKHLAVNSD